MNRFEKDCYRLIQQVVVAQFPVCRVPWCNQPASVGHHLFPRARHGTAFNPNAVFSCCEHHHDLFHSKRDEYRALVRSWIGEEYEQLRELSLMTVQFREEDFKKIRDILTRLLEEA